MELEPRYAVPDSRSYVTAIEIDPADWRRIERILDDSPELRVLHRADDHADTWRLHIGCATGWKRRGADYGGVGAGF